MIYVFETMGTVVSIEPPLRVREIEAVFAELNERFSLYRADSELSRIADGSLSMIDASPELRGAYARALEWRALTADAFTPHRPDGVVDLSGIVKALAMDAARDLLADSEHWILNAGGDVLTSGQEATVGITDPFDRTRLLTSVRLGGSRRAVATSGTAERGDHIWGRGGFAQVTVVADDIIQADVLATAIIAGGVDSLNASTSSWDIDVLAVDLAGNLFATPGFTSAIASALVT
ncbi:MAG TPA: FAD:protein FMN transferase [Galbitalea sp.]|jgi:thiamine biosynthesis lipoprotein|nr:FAD:protein FMN transferase [Galbitalea sp.]